MNEGGFKNSHKSPLVLNNSSITNHPPSVNTHNTSALGENTCLCRFQVFIFEDGKVQDLSSDKVLC